MLHNIIEKINKKTLVLSALLALLSLSAMPHAQMSPAGEEWLAGWVYRRPITITEQSGTDLENYQVRILLDVSGWSNKPKSDFSDLRFTDNDGTTELNYWVENYNLADNVIVWIKIPQIPANDNKTIYMYYCNPSASSASNGNNTFEFFDDFNDNDISDWQDLNNMGGSGTWGASGGKMTFDLSYWDGMIMSSTSFGDYIQVYESKLTSSSSAHNLHAICGRVQAGTSGADLYMTGRWSGNAYTYRRVSSSWQQISNTGSVANTIGTTYMQKLQISGYTLKYKIWEKGTAEPGWMITGTDTNNNFATGSIGVCMYNAVGTIDDVRVRKYVSAEPTYTIGDEEVAIPSQPQLQQPVNNSSTNDNTPYFEWTLGQNADNHRLIVDNSPNFADGDNWINITLGAAAGTYTTPVDNSLAEGKWYWKVVAINSQGENSSDVWNFIVDKTPPLAPSLSSPDNNDNTDDNQVTFSWTATTDNTANTPDVSNIAHYELWVDDNSNFPSPLVTENTSDNSTLSLTKEVAGKLYWRVRAWDRAGNPGAFSEIRHLTVFSFFLNTSSTSLIVLRGSAGAAALSIDLVFGDQENVDLDYTWEGMEPIGITPSFDLPSGTVPFSSTLTFQTSSDASTGEFTCRVIATSESGITRNVDISIQVAGMSFFVLASPTSISLIRSDDVASTISVKFMMGTKENIELSGSWLGSTPVGVSATFDPPNGCPSYDSTLTFVTTDEASAGSFTYRVTGSGGGLTQWVDLTVNMVVALTSTLNADEQSYKRGQEVHISGEVVDPKGDPVENGTAMITLSDGAWSEDIISTITNGTYSADYLIAPDDPGGEWTIAVDAEDNRGNVTLTSENITVNVTTNLTVTAATDASAYEKGQKIRISGTVKDPKGNPVESGEATITLKSGNWTDQLVTHITDGTYEENYYITFDKPEGDWTITVTAVDNHGNLGQVQENIGISVTIPASWKYYTVTFLSPAPGTVCSRGSEVTVTVQITGSPEKISRADVYLATPSGEIVTLTEGSPGIYSTTYIPEWDDPVGEWAVSVLGEKTVQDVYKAGTGSTSLDIAPANLELELLEPDQRTFEVGEKVNVEVKVSYPDGSPVDEAIVTADLPNGENLTLLNEGEGIYRGAYSVGSKDLGAWALTVSAGDAYGNSGASSGVTLSVEELSPSSYPIRYWWITIPVILACALVPLPIVVKKLRVRKLKSIKSEISATKKLRKELPKRYFVKGAISREIYDSLMHQTMEKLMKLKKEARRLQGKLKKGK
jgi:hypothetical protein